LSRNTVDRVVAAATHRGMVEEHAVVTTQAIVDVVASVRHLGPLPR